MDALHTVVRRFITRVPDMDEALSIEYVLDAAQAYADGDLPWHEAAKIGAVTRIDPHTGREIESTAYARFLALLFAEPDDPRRKSVQKLCNEIVEQSGAILTTHGLFDRAELHERNVIVKNA